MEKSKILRWFYIFLLVQPFIDLITSVMTKFWDLPITLGIIVRGLLFVFSIIYIFFVSKSKYKKVSCVYIGILIIYAILYFALKLDLFSSISFLVSEVTYMFKYFYTLIILLLFLNIFDELKPNNRIIFKLLQLDLLIYCFIIVLANITNTAFGTYAYGAGNSGWFYSGNEIGIILALLFPFLYLIVNKTNSYKCLFLIIPVVLAMEIIGTKTAMLGLLLPTIVFFIYYLIRVRHGKLKQLIMTLIILLVIVCSSPNLPVVANIRNSLTSFNDRITNEEEQDEDLTDEAVTKVLLSDRDYFEKKINKIYDNASIQDKLFGIGFTNRDCINDKNITKLIEMDFHDILYRYGIVGFIIYFLPFVLLVGLCLKECIKIRFKFNAKQLLLGYVSGVSVFIACFVGHTLGAPAVSFYVCLAIVMLIYYLKESYHKMDLDDNKVTIFALHLGTGGVEKYIASLCKMLEDNYEIEIISTYKKTEEPAFKISDNVKITYLINDYPHVFEFRRAMLDGKVIQTIKWGMHLAKILFLKYYKNFVAICFVKSKYIITTRAFHNKLVSDNKNRDCIAIATEHNYHNNNVKYVNKVVNSVENMDYFALVSPSLKDYYQEKLKDTKCECVFIPNVIDDIPKYVEHKKIYHKLVAAGRLAPEKGFSDLIDIIDIVRKDIKNIKLDIYGDGELRDELEEKIKRLGLEKNVKLCGFMDYDKLLKEMYNYDLYVMSSFTESFGLVLIEAMSRSLPCMAFSDADGAKYLLSNDVGILIDDRDKEAYAKEIIKVLKDVKVVNKYAKKGYDKAKEYLLDNVKEDWLKLLKKD